MLLYPYRTFAYIASTLCKAYAMPVMQGLCHKSTYAKAVPSLARVGFVATLYMTPSVKKPSAASWHESCMSDRPGTRLA